MSYWTNLAANTQLPIATDSRGSSQTLSAEVPPLFSLDSFNSDDAGLKRSPLLSIAKYKSFRPESLACSPPVKSTYSETERVAYHRNQRSPLSQKQQQQATDQPSQSSFGVSLGAVAGSHGVAVFRVNKLHTPLLVLNYAFNTAVGHGDHFYSNNPADSVKTTQSVAGVVSCLAFQPSSSSTLYLAGARGSGVLIWDVSGHSLNPLWGRIGAEKSLGLDSDSFITSLAWKPSSLQGLENDGSVMADGDIPCLAATTAASIGLWDLREACSRKSKLFKPSLRFRMWQKYGVASSSLSAPFVQVACSPGFECAALDTSGVFSVWDIRLTDRNHDSSTLASVRAFACAGMGLAYMSSSHILETPDTSSISLTRWLTWGLDETNTDATVKVWESSNADKGDAVEVTCHADRLSNQDDNISCSSSHNAGLFRWGDCRLVAQCNSTNLACARVCPSPAFKDTFFTMGFDKCYGRLALWHAELWKLGEGGKNAIEKWSSFHIENDKNVTSTLGQDPNIGLACASEVGFITQYKSTDHSTTGVGDEIVGPKLVLCSLTDAGYVMTHALPETVSKVDVNDKVWLVPKLGPAISSSQLRVFPPSSDLTLCDAANNLSATVPVDELAVDGKFEVSFKERFKDDASLPFDMDISGVYSLGGVSDLLTGGALPVTLTVADAGENTVDDVRAAANFMKKIETDKVPCPRFCGAVFGPGAAGLTIYHNGDIKKMWSWWEKANPDRMTGVDDAEISLDIEVENRISTTLVSPLISRYFPKTLKEFLDMTCAAKEAQWGEKNDSEVSSAGLRALSENFFEGGSESSTESDDDSEELHADSSKNLYENYFGDTLRPLVDMVNVRTDEHEQPQRNEQVDENTSGSSSDILAPSVAVTFGYDQLSLNQQSSDLAKTLILGEFLSVDFENVYDRGIVGSTRRSEEIHKETPPSKFETKLKSITKLSSSKKILPRYRLLSPQRPSTKEGPNPYVKPAFSHESTRQLDLTSEKDEDKGVHGGEYSVRPNMQESMVFLRKLFTHQQEGGHQFTSLLSPLDSPMLPNSVAGEEKAVGSQITMPWDNEKGRPGHKFVSSPNIGVYTLHVPSSYPNNLNCELEGIRKACLYNADVCASFNEIGKQQTWKLLAKAAASRIIESTTTGENWIGSKASALGEQLICNVLRYYESLGDVQMLSTIVCVFRTRRLGKMVNDLLPMSRREIDKYEIYIRRYSDLLFYWQLLEIRAEVCKFLSYVANDVERKVDDIGLGVNFVFSCSHCLKETDSGNNFCKSCHDFAFRCVICDNAVRGLFTSCESCGHGGHMRHLQEWFISHDVCPAGCGCFCSQISRQANS